MIDVLHILGTARESGRSIVTIVRSLAGTLFDYGYRCHAVFLGDDGPLRRELNCRGIPSVHVPWRSGARDPVGALRFAWALRSSRPAIVHQHFGGRSVRLLSNTITGAPVVFHAHSRGPEREHSDRRAVRIIGAAAAIAPSHSAAALIDHPFKRVIHTGVDLPSATRRKDIPPVIGTAARLVPIKGIDTLLRAVATVRHRLPSVRMEIAGDGPLRQDLEQLSNRLGCADIVSFVGFQHDIQQYLGRWSVFVLPSLDEALPVALLEAMAVGTAVVASRVGGVPELVIDGQTGILVAPADENALSDALLALLVDDALRHRLASAARTQVECKFTTTAMARAVAELYDNLLERAPPRG